MDDKVSDKSVDAKRPVVPYLGAVKIAAVIMGIMIVVGLAVIAVTIVKRVANKVGDSAPIEEPRTAIPAALIGEIGDLTAKLPAGAKIEALSLSGNALLLSIDLAGQKEVLIIDVTSGAWRGRIKLQPE